jgi:hypothetical protein
MTASALAWSPLADKAKGVIKHFLLLGFMNEMNKAPFKSFRLLRKQWIEIIPNFESNPGLIW